MTRSPATDLEVFESHRALLVAHAYRMLGDLGRAEDMVQEAWLRWDRRNEEVDSPRAYLVTIVTRLCFNELDSAKARREENRGDRLPEPLDLNAGGIGHVEMLEQISMAFLVALQRLTSAERAVLLLRDVFDFDYKYISELVGKNEPACRKLLERARQNVAKEKRLFSASPETHQRLLTAFTQAASTGDLDALVAMLAEDAVMITDGGAEGRRVAGIRKLQQPLHGVRRIAAFVAATARSTDLESEMHELNGQPALVFYEGGAPFAALHRSGRRRSHPPRLLSRRSGPPPASGAAKTPIVRHHGRSPHPSLQSYHLDEISSSRHPRDIVVTATHQTN